MKCTAGGMVKGAAVIALLAFPCAAVAHEKWFEHGFREVMFATRQTPEDVLASVNTDACHGVASTYNPRF